METGQIFIFEIDDTVEPPADLSRSCIYDDRADICIIHLQHKSPADFSLAPIASIDMPNIGPLACYVDITLVRLQIQPIVFYNL